MLSRIFHTDCDEETGIDRNFFFMNKYYSIFIASVMVIAMVLKPVFFADLMFLELWPSLLWALAIGYCATYQCIKGYMLLLLLAVMPVVAGGIYFGMSHASDDSFLLAGVIPWSDASMHFRQAAQMMLYGVTQTGMNGRFLYPAFFSSLLEMSSGNLLLAQGLCGLLFAGALVVALRETARSLGAYGAAVVGFVCWLFFRERCSGLVMTENLGLLSGILALGAFLMALRKRAFALLLLAIFMLALGLCARPGALLVLPLLIFFAGWVGWQDWQVCGDKRLPWSLRGFLGAVLAMLVIITAFSCNTLLSRALYEGKVIANQNFAFTLNGLLTQGKWSDCLGWSHWDAQRVMQENIRLIEEKPLLLVSGAWRAYKEAGAHRTLFQFHHESRPANLLLFMAIYGLIALWKKPEMRPYALWMSLMTLGILLSIPFAPPWDAAERPFAATFPFQGLLAGIGGAFFVKQLVVIATQFLSGKISTKPVAPLARRFHADGDKETAKADGVSPASAVDPCEIFALAERKYDVFVMKALCLLVFFLTVPWPLLHGKIVTSMPYSKPKSILRTGSFITVTPENRLELESRMEPFFRHYRSEAWLLDKFPSPFILGIDWKNKNLDRAILARNAQETFSFRGWQVDVRLAPQN